MPVIVLRGAILFDFLGAAFAPLIPRCLTLVGRGHARSGLSRPGLPRIPSRDVRRGSGLHARHAPESLGRRDLASFVAALPASRLHAFPLAGRCARDALGVPAASPGRSDPFAGLRCVLVAPRPVAPARCVEPAPPVGGERLQALDPVHLALTQPVRVGLDFQHGDADSFLPYRVDPLADRPRLVALPGGVVAVSLHAPAGAARGDADVADRSVVEVEPVDHG